MSYKSIYVAASSQHVGKTTSTLGLVSLFHKSGIKVGYSKPVGQNHIDVKGKNVDKDSVLFADLLQFEISPEIHSPVIFEKGVTKKLIEDPNTSFLDEKILDAQKELDKVHDIVIYEGTGHVGVGSVANLSNAKVAKLLGAEVVMIVEGGIGSTIDMLNMCLSMFREEGVPILGVIVNKVRPDKIESVEKYVGKWLERQNLKLLGVIPYDKTLGYPLVWTISRAIGGKFEFYEERGFRKVDNIVGGSILDKKEMRKAEDTLLVVSNRVLDAAITKLKTIYKEHHDETSPLAAIIVTGEGEFSENSLEYINRFKIPVIRTDLDTYGVVVKISKLEVKINKQTPWKISRAIDLIKGNVKFNSLLSLVKCDL